MVPLLGYREEVVSAFLGRNVLDCAKDLCTLNKRFSLLDNMSMTILELRFHQ